jgi:exodeoxyribonuclease VII large subunit
MSETFLNAPFKDKEKVKALGGRWDSERRLWYVPAGTDLAPFAAWMPLAPASTEIALVEAAGELAAVRRGMKLSELLAGVSQAVALAFKVGAWTMVEVLDTRLRGGHVYIEVSERDADGVVLAKANAVIWASTANRILPEFERATGAKIGPGIKLLVRARPVFKAQFGFSLEIDAIDPDYTLGDLEARKREIRARLQREGLFDANRNLPAPWDFNAVIVVAPQGAAGLGDFSAEAERLEKFGVCRFTYVYSRFQGEGAAAEIRSALLGAMAAWVKSRKPLPDAVAIIRGGGAVNDLAWLNDYDLARCICELEVPVLTGIGHERDSTVIDEVA